jgi:hypothetical protein
MCPCLSKRFEQMPLVSREPWQRGRSINRINHTFLKKICFTERTEFRREITEPDTLSML